MSEDYLDMSPEEFQELLGEFLMESEGHLQVLNEKLLQAEDSIKNGIDMEMADLNAMFRAAHTIKGTASFINLKKIVKLTHEMETILQRVKEGQMKLTMDIIDVLFGAFDTLEKLFGSLRDQGYEEGDIEDNVKEIQAVLNSLVGTKDEKVPVGENIAEEAGRHDKSSKTGGEEVEEAEEEGVEKAGSEVKSKAEQIKPQINEKYLKQFIIDAEENIENFNNTLINFEENMENSDLINDMFRFMHTIKGSSGIVNAVDVQKVAHSMENLLSQMREGALKAEESIITALFEGIDIIKALVDELKSGENVLDKDLDVYCGKLNSIISGGPSDDSCAEKDDEKSSFAIINIEPKSFPKDILESIARDTDTMGRKLYEVLFRIEKNVQAKDMKLLIVEERLSKQGKIYFEKPNSVELTENEPEGEVNVSIAFSTTLSGEEVKGLLSLDGVAPIFVKLIDMSWYKTEVEEKKEEREEVPVMENKSSKPVVGENTVQAKGSGQKAAPIEISTIRVDSHKIDNLMNLSGELVITRARFSQLVNQFNSVASSQKELKTAFGDLSNLYNEFNKVIKNIAVKKNVDNEEAQFQKIVSEMEKVMGSLNEKVTRSADTTLINTLDEVTSNLGKIASDIQSGVMQTRMIPVEGIFTRFKRVVRDISKTLGKNVILKIEGEDTELDKKIVDSLGDPLTHMIRNAVDHGIEDAETRRKLGKPEEGTVFLRASHKGNSFCIEVGDDGKGLDANKIAESAVKKGIVAPEQVEKMTDKEKLNLIFAPGFSTAEKVTGISGRGVGMDVVKNMITTVNGIVEIDTELGVGTTFILKIPLTLAIIQALLVVVGGETFAFPLDTVVEIIKVSKDDIYSIDGNDTVKLRGHALSIVDLENIIGLKKTEKKERAVRKVVVITDGESQLGVSVDDLIGGEEIVIKSLTEHFSNVVGITGASILGDGKIALILDSFSIIKAAK